MSIIFSIQRHEATAPLELRQLVSSAYAKKGTAVHIPQEALKNTCSDLPSKTTDEILAIRRRERAVSSQTLAFSFA